MSLPKNVNKLAKKEADEIIKALIKGKSHTLDDHYKHYPHRVSREIKKSVNYFKPVQLFEWVFLSKID